MSGKQINFKAPIISGQRYKKNKIWLVKGIVCDGVPSMQTFQLSLIVFNRCLKDQNIDQRMNKIDLKTKILQCKITNVKKISNGIFIG